MKLIRRSLKLDPKQPDLWLQLSQYLYDLQRYQEANQAAESAFVHNQMDSYPAFSADLLVMQASSLEALGRSDLSIDFYQKAIAIVQNKNRYLEDPYSPTVAELPEEEAKLWEGLARAAFHAKQWDLALSSYKKAELILPAASDRIRHKLAEVYMASGRPEAALAHLEALVKSPNASAETYRHYALGLEHSQHGEASVQFLEQLKKQNPDHTAILQVLGEIYFKKARFELAEQCFRHILEVEKRPYIEAIQGLYHALRNNKQSKDILLNFDQLLQQPHRRAWVPHALHVFLTDHDLFSECIRSVSINSIQATTRLLLIRLCIQAGLWGDAEFLSKFHLRADVKPQEAYILQARAQLEQIKLHALIQTCQEAIQHSSTQQPFPFYLEIAKAQARLHQKEPAYQALKYAKDLCSRGTTDEHKALCTEVYIKHLLGQQNECIEQAEALLATTLAKGPWARQIHYVAAHAQESLRRFDKALNHYQAILSNDPNDHEAQAAMARCLLFENSDLQRAEDTIRQAIELDIIEKFKLYRGKQNSFRITPNVKYQATLGSILLRSGKIQEAIYVLNEIKQQQFPQEPWLMLALGDGCLVQNSKAEASKLYQSALDILPISGHMGLDLSSSLHARILATKDTIIPASTNDHGQK
ncbi:MAG TPA: tetratricopeptide repeat protein [Gemmatales bacterium]|nr:tetratricopeptide repeat protein [Gemmatales bacterium]